MNVGQRVVLKGRDELGNMAKQVNLLLDGIEGLQKGVKEEKEKSERLVFNMLPEVIYERLKEAKRSDSGTDHVKTESESIISRMLIADTISEVSVLFSDMSGLYNFNAESTEMVRLLNTIFSGFDHVCSQVGVEKIKTIGNVFMAVAGAPVQVSDHAERAVKQALGMYNVTKIIGEQLGLSIGISIGINSGPIVAGVVGTTKYVYDIFGDTVNVASRMQSHGLTGHLHISETTHTSLNGKFPFEERGMTDIKGKGKMKTYLLDLEAIRADSEAQKKAIPIFKRKVEEPRSSSFYKNKIFPI